MTRACCTPSGWTSQENCRVAEVARTPNREQAPAPAHHPTRAAVRSTGPPGQSACAPTSSMSSGPSAQHFNIDLRAFKPLAQLSSPATPSISAWPPVGDHTYPTIMTDAGNGCLGLDSRMPLLSSKIDLQGRPAPGKARSVSTRRRSVRSMAAWRASCSPSRASTAPAG